MKKADQPAYPYPDMAQFDFSLGEMMGLTKREWFAGMAMQGILSNPSWTDALATESEVISPKVRDQAYSFADAMLEEEK